MPVRPVFRATPRSTKSARRRVVHVLVAHAPRREQPADGREVGGGRGDEAEAASELEREEGEVERLRVVEKDAERPERRQRPGREIGLPVVPRRAAQGHDDLRRGLPLDLAYRVADVRPGLRCEEGPGCSRGELTPGPSPGAAKTRRRSFSRVVSPTCRATSLPPTRR